jgi:hypothetical protein
VKAIELIKRVPKKKRAGAQTKWMKQYKKRMIERKNKNRIMLSKTQFKLL